MHESHITEVIVSVAPSDDTPHHLNCDCSTQLQPDYPPNQNEE